MRVARERPPPAAEPAHAADRFAREIVGILTRFVMRSQRLMGIPFGGHHQSCAFSKADESSMGSDSSRSYTAAATDQEDRSAI
jgi:hypothetical protein